MHASDVRTSSTPASSSSLRPRNRRLISGLSDVNDGEDDYTNNARLNPSTAPTTRAASPLPSPFDSRGGSPIPRERLSRPVSSRGTAGGVGSGSGSRRGNDSPIAGLWGSSWSTLQGFANDLLGSDAPTSQQQQQQQRTRRPLGRLHVARNSSSAPPGDWGPQAPTSVPGVGSIGMGSREEVENAVRAQKRKDLLTRGESYADSMGRMKRRTSDEDRGGIASSAPPGDHERRDALVYLHNVRKEDTLAGITIRYNCSANALRKANRMWPNDTVQSRPVLILPVDACGVKGKPISDLEAMDLLSDETDALSSGKAEEVPSQPPTTNGNGNSNSNALARNRTNSASTNTSAPRSLTAHSSTDPEPPWHHSSWTLLPGAHKPTEIARLSRTNIGYFPPARRKSLSASYSDLDTPSTSLDLTRTNTSEHQHHQHPALSPLRSNPPPQRPRRGRRPSNATSGYFPSYLSGPGGVGTMHKTVSSPGPGQDGLNKFFARHLPDVAPPRNQQSLYQPEMPFYDGDGGVSGAASPALNLGAANGNWDGSIDIGNVGGAIESWMRRVASKAKDAMEPPKAGGGNVGRGAGGGVGGASGIGDLIEMTDEFEIGEDEDEVRGRQGDGVGGGGGGGSRSSAYASTSAGGDGVRERSKVGYFGKGGKGE